MSDKKQRLFVGILGIIGSLAALGMGKYFLYSTDLLTKPEYTVGLEGLWDMFFMIPMAISLIVGGVLELIAVSKIRNNTRGATSYFYLSLVFIAVPSLFILLLVIISVPSHVIAAGVIYAAAFLALVLSPIIAAKLTKNLTREISSETANINKHFNYRKLAGRLGTITEIILFLSPFYFSGPNQNRGVGSGVLLGLIAFLIALFGIIEIYPLKNIKKGAVSFIISGSMLLLTTPASTIDITLLIIISFLFIGAGFVGLQESLTSRLPNREISKTPTF